MIMNKRMVILGVLAVLVLSGFVVKGFLKEDKSHGPVTVADIDPVIFKNAIEWNKHAVDTAVSMLQSGDIVIRRGLGPDSYMLAQMNRKDKTWSHCGIVMVENGYPFVYHSIGGEDNPDERLRRDSAAFFFSPFHNTHIAIVRYGLSAGETERLEKIVHQYYKARPRFDMNFDLGTDDKLYCSEFVYKAVNKAVNDSAFIKPFTRSGRRIVGIDDLFLNGHAQIMRETKFK
jgi:hypothetical protein